MTNLKWLKQVEQKHVVRTLPKPVLCRIHELATIHPYPRVRKSKTSCDNNIDSSKLLVKANGAQPSSCGRIGRRKRHT